jgi:S-methyl-5-thioribose kinase
MTARLYEDQRRSCSAPSRRSTACCTTIWVDLLGFAGVEIHRRILGLAHNADFETIANEDVRAICETKALHFGRHIAVNRRQIHSLDESQRARRPDSRKEQPRERRRPPLPHHLAQR